MKITFLGTGTSTGVPEIGCKCEVCTSENPKDKRMRTSALVEVEGKRIVIDCGPDFRCQMLSNNVDWIDAVLITHEHYDHVGGLDDLRPLGREKDLQIYAEANVIEAIETRMPYAFEVNKYLGAPKLELQPITTQPFFVAGIQVIPIRLMHACLPIIGFRIGNMAYLSDFKYIPEEEYEKLEDLDLLVIEALKKGGHPSHEGLEEALININQIQPKEAYFIHMSHKIGLHAVIDGELPPHTHLSYDNLSIEF